MRAYPRFSGETRGALDVTFQVIQRIGREVGRKIQVTLHRDGDPGARRLTLITESDKACT